MSPNEKGPTAGKLWNSYTYPNLTQTNLATLARAMFYMPYGCQDPLNRIFS